jgi:membrane protein implicated in regulation of membrane protease activity
VIAGRAWIKQRPVETDHPTLNRRGAQYVGKSFVLKEAIVNGEGVIVVDDTSWKVRGADTPVGERVKITDTDGSAFVVEPV